MPDSLNLTLLGDTRLRRTAELMSTTLNDAGQPVYHYWKELARIGNFVHPGTGQPIIATKDRLAHWCSAGNEMIQSGVRVPVNIDHQLTAPFGLGKMEKYEVRGNGLFGLMEVVGSNAPDLLSRNDVSIGFVPKYPDLTGRVWEDVIYHVAITQFPVFTNLKDAVAASQVPAVGNAAIYLAADSTGVHTMPDPILTPDHLKAFRGHTHLCNLSGVPDEGVPTALSTWHAKHAENLSALRREIPGGCPEGEEMPRITQHLSTLRHVKDKLSGAYPALLSMTPGETEAAIDSKIDEWSGAAKLAIEQAKTIEGLQSTAVELSSKLVKDVPAEAVPFISEAISAKKSEMVRAGFKPFAADAFLNRAMSDGKANAVLCSAAANPFGSNRALILDLADIVIQGLGSPTLGSVTGGQSLSRVAPSETLHDNDVTKRIMAEMQGKKA